VIGTLLEKLAPLIQITLATRARITIRYVIIPEWQATEKKEGRLSQACD